MTKLPIRVYSVSSDRDETVRIALGVTYDQQRVQWFDTVKERRMRAASIVDPSPDHFVFERAAEEGGGTYTFIPMTLAVYNEKVKAHIVIPQEFTDEESMLRAFEKTQTEAW
ncbi:hypothetical protein HY629_02980 [Candidatus Uhrbacteria bacterium]|nr:hypothetical protein [Candidatus Uhrbacteria bacterium]